MTKTAIAISLCLMILVGISCKKPAGTESKKDSKTESKADNKTSSTPANYDDKKLFEGDYIAGAPKEHKIPDKLKDFKADPEIGKIIYNKVGMGKKGKNPKDSKKLPAGNCAACHSGKGVKGGGDVGPEFSAPMVAKWKKDGDAWLFKKIGDARTENPNSNMPPTLGMKTGKKGIEWKPEHILHLIAYLKTFK